MDAGIQYQSALMLMPMLNRCSDATSLSLVIPGRAQREPGI